MAAELLGILAEPIKEAIVAPLQRHLSYPFTYKSNLQNLQNQLDKLTVARDNWELSARDDAKRGNQTLPTVLNWLRKAAEAIQKAEDAIRSEDEAGKQMFSSGCFSILKSRYRLSKTAVDQAAVIAHLLDIKFDRISRRPTLKQTMPSLDFGDLELGSRSLAFNQVMDALEDPHIHMVGVYGLSGTGKSVLASKVQSRANQDNSYDLVYSITVSSTKDPDSIRKLIADYLGLEFKDETAEWKADKLRQKLMEKKKVLIILDDIWGDVPLRTIGIPCGKDHKGCKILLTSRSQTVLDHMDPKKTIILEPLPEDEAWSLFESMVGGIKNEVRDVAIQIAKKCAGLPLLIATVAKALKNKGLVEWKYALKKLSKTDQESVVYSGIELSYKHLISDQVKSFFLLCAQLGEPEIPIDHLLFYCVSLGLLQQVDTIEDGRTDVLMWIKYLKAAWFLLDSDRPGFVKIHDLVRDVALSIASRHQNILAVTSDGIMPKEWPKEDNQKKVTRICLPHCVFLELPEISGSGQADLMILGSEDGLLNIPALFFQRSKNLKVLNLSNFYFSRLPISLASLSNLRTLCLDKCEFLDGSIIGKLNNLSILSCSNCRIEELPGEIALLTELKILDLRGCYGLEFIPADVLSKLSLLEELYIGKFSGWGTLKMPNNQRNASLEELEELSHLTTLEIHIPDAKMISKGLFSKNLGRFTILIGEHDWYSSYEPNTLFITLFERIHLESWFKMFIKRTENLQLNFDEEMGIIRNMLYDLDDKGFPQLKYLHIKNSTKIQHLINSMNQGSNGTAFPILESLCIKNFTGLQKICHGRFPTGSFSELTILKVVKCSSLKNIFPSSMFSAISKLKKLVVKRCDNMKEIVAKESEGEATEAVVFTNLHSLSLHKLCKLRSFCSGVVVEFPQLHTLTLNELPHLRGFCSGAFQTTQELLSEDAEFNEVATLPPLFDEMVQFPAMEKIEIAGIVDMKKIWPSKLLLGSFGKLKSLTVQNCGKLETVFPFNQMGTFQKLEILFLSGCDVLQEIYPFPDENSSNVPLDLKELSLFSLPQLKHIWSRNLQETLTPASLQSVRISNCNALEYIFPASIALSLEKLRVVTFSDCEMMREIIQSDLEDTIIQQIVFPSLNEIMLHNLPNLCFCSGSANIAFPSLKRIEILGVSKNWRKDNPRKDDAGSDRRLHLSILPFFNHEVAPSVEELKLDTFSMEMIFKCLPGEVLFWTLKNVHLTGIAHKYLSEFLEGFQNLDELYLESSSIREVFGDDHGRKLETSVPLKGRLTLSSLHQLKHIWKHGGQYQLESLEVNSCSKLITLAPPSASFQNLSSLIVYDCHGLTTLVTASAARNMMRLTVMTISCCSKLIQVVTAEEDANIEETITFPKLKTLVLDELRNFISFSSGTHSFEFPSLERVYVDGCPKMSIFCNKELVAPKLRRVQTFSHSWYWEGNLNDTIQHIFMRMVAFVNNAIGWDFRISEYPQLQEKWQSGMPLKFLEKISTLIVDRSSILTKAVPSNALHFLDLYCLTVEKCDSVEEIFDLRGLKYVQLMNNLCKLHLIELPSLKYVFTPGVALALAGLNLLEVKQCAALKEIIKKEEGAGWDRTIEFLELFTIMLHDLPALTSFYSESGVVKCPLLHKVDIVGCPKIFDLVNETSDYVAEGDRQSPISNFFESQLGFSRIAEFGVEWQVIKETTEDVNSDFGSLRMLRTINLMRYSGNSEIFSSDFFHKLPYLRSIVISDAFVEDISVHEESKVEVEGFAGSLELSNLPNLKQMIWWNNTQPSKTYFQNITKLKLSKCHELVNLFPSSIANCMHQLQSMEINNCRMLKEIVASDGAEDVVCFSVLESLTLAFLPRLTSFFSNGCALSFPSLHRVNIEECPSMKFFVQGSLTTPKLEEFLVEGHLYREDSLDNIVREFAEKM